MQTQQYPSEPIDLPSAVNAAAGLTADASDCGSGPDTILPPVPSCLDQAPFVAAISQISPECQECPFLIEYRKAVCERSFWQKMHQKAVEREVKLKETIAELEAKVRLREKQLFGKKTEKSNHGEKAPDAVPTAKKRGQQPGSVGHGRRSHAHLPAVEESIDLAEDQKLCNRCGLPFHCIESTEDSQEIEIEVRAYRRIYKRKKYKPTCGCDHLPAIITAPPAPKLIPKSSLGISIWITVLLDKYLYQHPTHRLLAQLRTHGLHLCAGTLTAGLQKLAPLFEPVAQAILEKNRSEKQWHADETRWLVFATVEDKVGHLWYMWVFLSQSTVVFHLDPSRSADVPETHFGDAREGFLIVDRYSAYKKFVKGTQIILCFCWGHQRRDFLKVASEWPKIEAWAMDWVDQIGNLYHLNDLRLAQDRDSDAYGRADAVLRAGVDQMALARKEQLAQPNLHPAARKVLESMENHWAGLTVFVDHPEVPMDNNKAERAERTPAVGRKSYYGSGSLWSGQLCATLFTLFQTLLLWGINPRLWLNAFLWACTSNGSQAPADVSCWLPWNMSPEQRNALSMEPPVQDSS